MKRYVTGILVALLCTAGVASARAHIPNECASQAHQAHERVVQYTDSLAALQGLPAAELSSHMPEIRRAFQLSIQALEAASAVVTCAMDAEKMEEPAPPAEEADWQPQLDELLVIAEEHEVALSIARRCQAAQFEVIYGRRSTSGPFIEEVSDWVRAKREGNEYLADSLYAVIIGRVEGALRVHEEMQRRQIVDRDRYVFSRQYTETCRAEAIKALAGE